MYLFFLEAFERIHKERVEEYELLSREIDRKVKETEPGNLIHVQTKVSEDDRGAVYRWLEVFASQDALQEHLDNEHVQAHVTKLNDGFLSAPLEVIIHCDWTEEEKEHWRKAIGIPITFAPLVNGYFR
jgi:quinol monooxygenase YgiN